MSMTRKEILPGVWLNHIQSSKFKTAVMSITMLAQMNRETAAMNALIPSVLMRGTSTYPDLEALNRRMDELYSADVSPVVRACGEIQCVGFMVSFAEAKYLPVDEHYTTDVIKLTADILLHPLTKGGLLYKDYVESEKQKLAENIRSRINDKRSYSVLRCTEEMCCYEDLAVGRFGAAEDCEEIQYRKLTKQYHDLLQTAPVEIFYCGSESADRIAFCLSTELSTMPRGTVNYDIGTDIRMNSVEEQPRYYEEKMDVTQGKLVMGYRLGEWMENPDPAILSVFNVLYGSGVTSKLFRNVREKLQLCYYAYSNVNFSKGIMLVASGIDFDRFEEAKAEIQLQLEEVKQGNFTEEELAWAKASVRSDLEGIPDSASQLESYYFYKIVNGMDLSPEEYIELLEKVTAEQVIEVAKSTVLDLVYFLRNDPDAVPEDSDESGDEV